MGHLFRVAKNIGHEFHAYVANNLAPKIFQHRDFFTKCRLIYHYHVTFAQPSQSYLHTALMLLSRANDTSSASRFLSNLIFKRVFYSAYQAGLYPHISDNPLHHSYVLSEVEVNEQDSKGETPIFYAIRLGKIEFIQCLANNDADWLIQNNEDEFLYDIALTTGNESIIALVEELTLDTLEERAFKAEEEELLRRILPEQFFEIDDEETLIDEYRDAMSMQMA